MDLQTQVVDPNTVTATDLNVAARVDQFKKALAEVRSMRVGMVEKMRGIVDEVKNLAASRDNMIGLFASEAQAMYPELIVKNPWEFAQSSESPFQLRQLFLTYQVKLDSILGRIGALTAQYNVLATEDQVLAGEEKQHLTMYGYFAASTPGAPSPEQLSSELDVLDVIPSVEEGSVIAKASALESLPEYTADAVTLQAVQMETDYDRHDVNEALNNQMIDYREPVIAASGFEVSLRDPSSSGFKKWHLLLGGALAAYFLFGRSK